MGRDLSFAPRGLIIERIETETVGVVIVTRPASRSADCRSCGSTSARVHSTYQRFLGDLPSQGRAVRIQISSRRFRCTLVSCSQRIFTERLEATGLRPFGRRTTRLEGIVHHLGLALGGRPGQSFARRLLLPVSKDTLRKHSVSTAAVTDLSADGFRLA